MPQLSDEVIEAAISRAKQEVVADILKGRVPRDVKSFSELHDYVDANEYGGLTEGPFYDEARLADPAIDSGIVDHSAANRVQDAVDVWLKKGRPPTRLTLSDRVVGPFTPRRLVQWLPTKFATGLNERRAAYAVLVDREGDTPLRVTAIEWDDAVRALVIRTD